MIYDCEPNCRYCRQNRVEAEQRFWGYVDKTESCWIWIGGVDKNGYGRFSYMGSAMYAHIFSKALTEPIDELKELDHLCRNRACVKPEHLEQVSHKTNVLRSPIAPPALNSQKTHCPKGHKYDRQNTVRWGKKRSRYCRECNRVNATKNYLQNRKRFA